MNPLRVNFDELYRRHLCRHGDIGINVLHWIAVVGIYFALTGLIDAGLRYALEDTQRLIVMLCLTLPWLVTLVFNAPIGVAVVSGVMTSALIAGVVLFLPTIPAWMFVVLILLLHQFQQWGHKLYPMHRDMTAFRDKYPKGLLLFLLLSVYELPILVQFFMRTAARTPPEVSTHVSE